MSLTVIATPIGNPKEVSQSALELIPQLDLLICESRKETSRLLRGFEVRPKEYAELSEHSDKTDLKDLLERCRNENVGLVSDCGTPGFCDPGAHLVRACRDQKIPVRSLPGPSSLMAFLSICGEDIQQFYFRGFLSQKTEIRKDEILQLKKDFKIPIVLMDTPYRLEKLLTELSQNWSNATLVLGSQLGFEDEFVLKGSAKEVLQKLPMKKAEFILLILP
ncbi:MAG: methyltransferase [Bdellovibrionaceae bacterium]|nr:methyltransferase [Pseudobdellovibrionaceae bacterium]